LQLFATIKSVNTPKLYFFVGFPGAGKTTLAKAIASATDSDHIWADDERHKLFPEASHTEEESVKLYDILNQRAEQLLSEGKSVVFDTNFNFYEDRQAMREIAARQNAGAVMIWLNVPKEIARKRAVCSGKVRNGYTISMSAGQFDAIANKLDAPRLQEKYIKIEDAVQDSGTLKQVLES
jgi:predicted kinase